MEILENDFERVEKIERSDFVSKKVLTLAEACQYMGISKSSMYKLTYRSLIPHYCPTGKLIYFKLEELESWLLQNRRSTDNE